MPTAVLEQDGKNNLNRISEQTCLLDTGKYFCRLYILQGQLPLLLKLFGLLGSLWDNKMVSRSKNHLFLVNASPL